ncbi:extracellular matrix regulator RemB [Desulfitobacterium sp.]|uniref:extracellular matrix regulator RemB n=1 Tax=Desulfitobacterium sp. TaxID=49981 RepID=UPI002B7E540C|nr:extracellular matrix/biofilm biosynthesis regulator RemA family protein [Desulfitobacterium sp.]HVJ49104.1 extracellular matrix/biofilm biosynthesis regulator RemA family protein [Desulfitobacterium sp.]
MFLHLGGDVLVNQQKVIAILDLETAMKNTASESFLNSMKQNEKIYYISDKGKEKSLIITTEGNYLSPISSTTLLKRSITVVEQEE